MGIMVGLTEPGVRRDKKGPSVQGRNGPVYIRSLIIDEYQGHCAILGVSTVQGVVVNGGIYDLRLDDLLQAARLLLEAHGYQVSRPESQA